MTLTITRRGEDVKKLEQPLFRLYLSVLQKNFMNRTRAPLALFDGGSIFAHAATCEIPGERIGSMAPLLLARAALRAVREDRRDPHLWRAIANRGREVVSSLDPQSLASLAFSFASQKMRDNSLMAKIAEEAARRIREFSVRDLSLLLASFSRLEIRSDLLFTLASKSIAREAATLPATELSEFFHSFGALQYHHPTLFPVLIKRVAALSGTLSPGQVTKIFAAAGKLGLKDEKLLAILAVEASKQMSSFTPAHLAIIANASMRLNMQNRFMLELLASEVFTRKAELPTQGVALILNACVNLGIGSQLLFDSLVYRVIHESKNFDIKSIVMCTSAISRLPVRNEEMTRQIFTAAGDRIAAEAGKLTPSLLSSLLEAFAATGQRHGPLLFHAPLFVAGNLGKFTFDQIAVVLKTFATFAIADDRLFDALVPKLPELVAAETEKWRSREDVPDEVVPVIVCLAEAVKKPCQLTSVVDCLESFARLYMPAPEATHALLDAFSLRSAEATPSDHDRVAKAVSTLQITQLVE